ncbi:RluA family pseudouridine synthase [Paenibacillus sp. FJAT-26967]|uniref:RluA family pseudouridine synthase n=1 Tax=Paenibacillus sp. FJAT-26967 TaxID=1729690 RepID=UPI000B1CF82E|nr:RluA family pseudouridine synthase [Paenibacillus sp. FJAT-26967]
MMHAAGKRKGEWIELMVPAERATWEDVYPFLPIPQKLWRKLEREGGIRNQGPRLLLRIFPQEAPSVPAEWTELEIVYEDDYLLVVNKPAGMAVHPAEPGQGGTLANAVAGYYESTGQGCAVRHIHRLDQDTSGAVLYAKYELPHVLLDEAMREKAIERIYAAVCAGHPAPPAGTVAAPIGKDRHHRSRRRVSPGGDHAVTHYRTLQSFRGAALLELRLETGRTHQIRVHMSYLGHPLLGDTLYGGSPKLFARQALHGARLLLRHPITGEELDLEASYPDDFNALLAALLHKN